MRRVALAGAILAMTLAARLIATSGGGGIALPAYPSAWLIERHVGNPVIDVADNPAETTEQYVPAPVILPNGDIWVYVKGASRIYAWRSTDDGETFALQNGGAPVLAPVASTWESHFVLEPTVTYDVATDTLHLYYKGRASGANTWAWGHVTASASDPTDFTRDPANPILTSAQAAADLGGGTVSDLALSCVVRIAGSIHFYGYLAHNSRYKLVQTTGADWDSPGDVEVIYTAANDNEVVETPSVIRVPSGDYAMWWSIGGPQPDPRWIRVASSPDALDWTFDAIDVISPVGSGWEEDEAYSGQFLRAAAGPTPHTIDGRWLLYYSGLEDSVANSGLIYVTPD